MRLIVSGTATPGLTIRSQRRLLLESEQPHGADLDRSA